MARGAPLLLTSLPKPGALHATAAALADAALPPRILVETGTILMADKLVAEQVLRAAGHTALDCPLSGNGAQVVHRDLLVYASRDGAAIAQCRDLFAGFARVAHEVGGEFATSLDMPTALFSATLPIYAATLAQDLGGEDKAAVHAVIGRVAGLGRSG